MDKRIFILMLLLLAGLSAAAIQPNMSIGADNVYYAWSTPELRLTSEYGVHNCILKRNGVTIAENFDVNLSHRVMVDFGYGESTTTVNEFQLLCWADANQSSVLRTVYYHSNPISLWGLFLSPLLMATPAALVLPAVPMVFFQSIPVSPYNDIAYLIYLMAALFYIWSGQPELEKGGG